MPAKKQVPQGAILSAATEILRESGFDALNIKALAEKLGCSTQPIYLSFRGMEEVRNAVSEEVVQIYRGFLERELSQTQYPPYKAYGMGYIRFAREEKQLFRFLFMRPHTPSEEEDGELEKAMQALVQTTGLTEEDAFRFHVEMWVFVHGIASMLATGYLDLDEDKVSGMITDAYQGLRLRFGLEGERI